MQLDLYFKNVGQGDTIFLQWEQESKYALIDCNLVRGGIRQVINHIVRNKIRVFEFMLMSHPHSDHFSGFPELLKYCDGEGIIIKKFIHTATFDPKRLGQIFNKPIITEQEHYEAATSTVNREKHKDLLWKLFQLLDEQARLNSRGFIKSVHTVNNDYKIELEGDVQLKFLAPYEYREFDCYIDGTYNTGEEEKLEITKFHENNPKANYLSSFLQIYSASGGWQLLLCSDVTSYTLERIFKNDYEFRELQARRPMAIQIPHHGSLNNHYPAFWEGIRDIDKSNVVVSVGNRYGHPNVVVIDYFKDLVHSIHATNYVGGFKESYEDPTNKELSLLGALLDFPGLSDDSESNNEPCLSETRCCEKHIRVLHQGGKAECQIIDV